jgi:hypothetical protein
MRCRDQHEDRQIRRISQGPMHFVSGERLLTRIQVVEKVPISQAITKSFEGFMTLGFSPESNR